MLMFVCVAWISPTYAQDPIHFPATSWQQTISGVTVRAAYPTGSSFDVYGDGSDEYGYIRITYGEGKIVRVVLNADADANLLMANDGEFTSKTSTSATWEGSSDNILFSAENDVYVTSIDVYVSAGSSTPAATLDGTPQLVSVPYDNTFDDIESLLAIDNNADGNTFKAADGVVSIKQHAVNQNDDYLVICKANLIANKKYNLSFDAKSTIDNVWHYYGVYVGTEPTASSLTTLINSTPWASVRTTNWEPQTATEFTVGADGTYYFAIHHHAYSGSASMLIDNFHLEAAPADMPAAVEEVTVEPDDAGELSATISFTMPSVNYGGDEYSDDKQLTYHIYRCQSGWGELGVGDVEIASGNAIAGSDVEYVDTEATNGQNYYAVVITDGALTSRVARGSAYVGADIPNSPSNVQMSVNGNRVTLTWDAPTRGQNGGFIGTPTYNVYTYVNYTEGSVINDSPITETTYSFDYDMNSGEQRDVKFSVKAVTTGGSSYSAYTPNSINVGAPFTLPFVVDFSSSSNRYKYEGTNCWGGESNSEYDMYTWVGNEALNFITGKIDFAGSNAQLSFDYKADASNITFDVIVLDQNGNENLIETISNPTDSYQRAVVDFTGDYKNDNWVKVMIRVNLKGAYYHAYFDNLSIIAKAPTYAVTVDSQIANGTVTADKTEAEAGETVTLTATPAVGYQFGSWAVTTTAGGTPVAVANNQFTMPAEDVTVTATFTEKQAYTITISNAIENGSVSASASENYEGEEIVLTAIPASGYELESWIVTNVSTEETITVTDNKFTMPAANVIVSANFVALPNGPIINIPVYSGATSPVDGIAFSCSDYMSGSMNLWGNGNGTLSLSSDNAKILRVELTCEAYNYSNIKDPAGLAKTVFETNSNGNISYNGAVVVWKGSENSLAFTATDDLLLSSVVVYLEEGAAPAPTYAVTIGSHDHGTLSTDVTEAEEGATVNVTATPNEGYELTSITVNGEAIVGTSFTMPAEDVTVAAVFTAINYTISVSNAIANGSVVVEGDVTTATAGTVITLVPSAEDGYVFKSWNVRRDDTQALITVTNNQFTMPAANVTVSATFDEPSPEYDWSHLTNLDLIAHNSDGYWATFSSTSDVVIIGTEDVYAVTLEGDIITLSSYDEVSPVGASGFEGIHVPANTGVLLNADVDQVSYMPVSNYKFGEAPANLLHPSTEAMAPMAGTHKFYKLAYSDYLTEENLGFYYGAENGGVYTVRNGAAYLAVPNSAAASVLHGFSFEDIENGFTTSLKAIESLNAAEQGVYTLDGRKVSEGQIGKGAYIVNGKKVINF